ncbi:MAG TPA: hypothetical protein PLZ55_06225, partial [bacterium]|nr:hypothetical protein [bacterium]
MTQDLHRQEEYHDGTFHVYDYDRCRRHLAGFYGYLARIQNQVLIERLQGRTVFWVRYYLLLPVSFSTL